MVREREAVGEAPELFLERSGDLLPHREPPLREPLPR
jgi:hypothetical protein